MNWLLNGTITNSYERVLTKISLQQENKMEKIKFYIYMAHHLYTCVTFD